MSSNKYTTFIDLVGQNSSVQTNFLKHVTGDDCYVGNRGSVYFFEFNTEESRDLFIRVINQFLTSKNIKSNIQ